MAVSDKPILVVDDALEWERWLEGTDSAEGVRLRLRKTASSQPGPTYAEALDVALCFGWIDGQTQSLDADHYLQVFTPRRRNSMWSKRNREHVARLTDAGRMRPAGQAEVDRAKADGRWQAAYRQADKDVPDDLQRALDGSPAASAAFAALSSQNRFAIILRLVSAKRADTRERRIAGFVQMLERGESIHPQRRR